MAKVPAEAKEVFSGIIFDVYHWDQKMFDGSTETFERLKRLDTVGILPVTSDNKIIITKQEQPAVGEFYGVLGGRVEKGEDPFSAAKRELLEEAGIESNNWIHWFTEDPLNKIEWNIYNYIVKDFMYAEEPQVEAGEKIELIEVTLDELMKIILKEDFRDWEIAIKLLRAQQDSDEFAKVKKLFEN